MSRLSAKKFQNNYMDFFIILQKWIDVILEIQILYNMYLFTQFKPDHNESQIKVDHDIFQIKQVIHYRVGLAIGEIAFTEQY
jgi:hypothetical protein